MPIGKSGRIVLEVDPNFKKKLYSELASEGISLKEWFLSSAKQYIQEKSIKPEAENANSDN